MKTLLCVAFHVPPSESIAAVRMRGFAKYLPTCGWEPVFLCPRLEDRAEADVRVLETPYRGDVGHRVARRLAGSNAPRASQGSAAAQGTRARATSARLLACSGRAFLRLLAVPDPQRAWLRDATPVGLRFLRDRQVSAILSSGPPWTSHLIASRLAAASGLPWMAEYRDLWTASHYYPYGPVRRRLDRIIEERTVGKADFLSTVSEPLSEDLACMFPGTSVAVVRNGFDPDDVGSAPLTKTFTITHTGQLYRGRRDPVMLLEAVRALLDAGEVDPQRIRIRFYGPPVTRVAEEVTRLGLADVVESAGRVSRVEALRRQRESQILLLLNWSHPQEVGVYTGKLFDYLASRRPILAVGGVRGVVTDLLRETNAGEQILDVDRLAVALGRMYREYAVTGQVEYRGNSDATSAYSQENSCRQLAAALDGLLSERLGEGTRSTASCRTRNPQAGDVGS